MRNSVVFGAHPKYENAPVAVADGADDDEIDDWLDGYKEEDNKLLLEEGEEDDDGDDEEDNEDDAIRQISIHYDSK